jgi:antitoxin HigA-1
MAEEVAFTEENDPNLTEERIPFFSVGDIILTEFLEPMGTSQVALAQAMNVPPERIYQIIKGKRRISIDTAIRLGLAMRTSTEFWLNLQNSIDLMKEQDTLLPIAKKEVTPLWDETDLFEKESDDPTEESEDQGTKPPAFSQS